jgi:hypothetical protein
MIDYGLYDETNTKQDKVLILPLKKCILNGRLFSSLTSRLLSARLGFAKHSSLEEMLEG